MVVRDGERRRKWACACPTAVGSIIAIVGAWVGMLGKPGRDPLLGIEMSEERGRGRAGGGRQGEIYQIEIQGDGGLDGG